MYGNIEKFHIIVIYEFLYIRLKSTSFYLKCCVLSFLQLKTTNYSDLKGFYIRSLPERIP